MRSAGILILFLFLCSAAPPSSQISICTGLRKGHFLHRYTDPASPDTTIFFQIYRHDSTQIEINGKTGDTSWYTILWTDTCIYELRLRNTTLSFSAAAIRQLKTEPLQTTITGKGANYYTFIARRSDTDPYSEADTVWILK